MLDTDPVFALQSIAEFARSMSQSLATIAAIQSRRERHHAIDELQRLTELAVLAEERAAKSAENAAIHRTETNDEGVIRYAEKQADTDRRVAVGYREDVDRFRLIYQDVLTLGDVAQPAEVRA